jgi:hypothetical protein
MEEGGKEGVSGSGEGANLHLEALTDVQFLDLIFERRSCILHFLVL